jgi:cytochrome c-type biogenesis protein CcmH
MSTKFFLLTFIATALRLHAALLSAQAQTTLGEIKKSLICLCECNMTVEACEGAMACEAAGKLTTEAQQLIDKGKDKPEILASFIGRYGEHILAAPTKKGFNLTAWILPFAAIIFAGVGVITVLRRWARRPQTQNEKPKINAATPNDSVYEKKLEEVLRALD